MQKSRMPLGRIGIHVFQFQFRDHELARSQDAAIKMVSIVDHMIGNELHSLRSQLHIRTGLSLPTLDQLY